jgi:hypothetical protein
MMTRKDYVAVADILSDYVEVIPPEEYVELVREFSAYMSEDNPRFQHSRFFQACGLPA